MGRICLKIQTFQAKYDGEILSHVYDKRQTSDSSWEFLKIQKEQMKWKQSTTIFIDKSYVKLLIFK